MNQHIEPFSVMICAYCGQSHGTLLPSEHDEDGNPIRWHHVECKKAADREYLQRQWQRQYIVKGGL